MSHKPKAAAMTETWAFASLVAAMTFTGTNVPIGKIVAAEMPVMMFLIVRFAVATLALLAVTSAAERRALTRLAPALRRDILWLALVGSVLFTWFLIEGSRRTTASEAGLITATLPAVVALLAALVLRQRLGRQAIAAVALSVAGLAIVQAGGLGEATAAATETIRRFTGNALVAIAVLCEATFVLLSKRGAQQMSAVALSLAVSAVSLVLAIPFAVIELWHLSTWPDISPGTWTLAVWYGLSASVFCTILWYRGAAHAESWQAGLATTALPISALALSAVALDERLGPLQAMGAALVIAAIVIGALPLKRWSR